MDKIHWLGGKEGSYIKEIQSIEKCWEGCCIYLEEIGWSWIRNKSGQRIDSEIEWRWIENKIRTEKEENKPIIRLKR